MRKVLEKNRDLYCSECDLLLVDALAKDAHDRSDRHRQQTDGSRSGEEKAECLAKVKETALCEGEEKDREICNEIAEDVAASLLQSDALPLLPRTRDVEIIVRTMDRTKTLRSLAHHVQSVAERYSDSVPKEGLSKYQARSMLRSLEDEILRQILPLYESGPLGSEIEKASRKMPNGDCERVKPCTDPPVIFSAPSVNSVENFSLLQLDADTELLDEDSPVTQTEPDSPVCLPISADCVTEPNDTSPPIFEMHMVNEDDEESVCLAKVEITWKLTREAEFILKCNQGKYPNAISDVFVYRFSRDGLEDDVELWHDAGSHEYLVREFQKLRLLFLERRYDHSEWELDIRRLLGHMERDAGYATMIRECYEMLFLSAVEIPDFRKTMAPLSCLIQLYQDTEQLPPNCEEYVSHWIVSLLLRDDDAENIDAKSVNASLECQLRQIPPGWFATAGVTHGLEVVRALLSNNYYKFFQLYENSEFHLSTEMRSQYLMVPFIPIVRQRALLIWGSPGSPGPCPYFRPARTSLRVIMEQLKWYTEVSSPMGRRWLATDARKEMKDLGIHVESLVKSRIPRHDGSEEYINAKLCSPLVKPVPFVDFATILGFLKSKNLLSLA